MFNIQGRGELRLIRLEWIIGDVREVSYFSTSQPVNFSTPIYTIYLFECLHKINFHLHEYSLIWSAGKPMLCEDPGDKLPVFVSGGRGWKDGEPASLNI